MIKVIQEELDKEKIQIELVSLTTNKSGIDKNELQNNEVMLDIDDLIQYIE